MLEFSIHLFNRNQQIVEKTIEQLNKDFYDYDIDFILSNKGESSYQNLILQISDVLKELSKQSGNKLQSLLYRIDIPEKLYVNILKTNENYFEQLADIILRRECFKVITRINYSQHE
jgi:hypothetical protein